MKLPECVVKSVFIEECNSNNLIEPLKYQVNKNPDTDEVYSITSRTYKPINYQDSIDYIQEMLDKNPVTQNNVFDGVELFSNGGKMLASWSFPEFTVKIGDRRDEVIPTMKLKTSYDNSWSWNIMVAALAAYCSNGMLIGDVYGKFWHRHTTGLDRDLIEISTDRLLNVFEEESGIWEKWAIKMIDKAQRESIVDNMKFSTKDKEELLEEVEVRTLRGLNDYYMTTWIFYSLMTQFITHKMGGLKRDRMAERFNRLMQPLRREV